MANKAQEFFKELIDLKQVAVPALAPKLKKYAKLIYYVGLVGVALMLLSSLAILIRGAVSVAFLQLLWAAVSFVVIRMFCEFLVEHKHEVKVGKTEKAK